MYIRELSIENVKSIRKLVWRCSDKAAPGWHTILGVNGAGKSSVLKSAALAILGPEGLQLKQDWRFWVRQNTQKGSCVVKYSTHENWDIESVPSALNSKATFIVQEGGGPPAFVEFLAPSGEVNQGPTEKPGIWHPQSKGYFSAAYGPFRRFTGGGYESDRSFGRVSRHVSAFDERAALTSALDWLKNLQFKNLETGESSTLEMVMRFVNQDDFLPGRAKLDSVTSSGVTFLDGNGAKVDILDMSDGFRSVLSLTFDILRGIFECFPDRNDVFESKNGKVTVQVPGVILIDEVDAHLHPSWQQKIGFWMCKHFPRMQFLVTTHSPFVCQASENGSVFVLENPGGKGAGRFLNKDERNRLIFGNVLDAYTTEPFLGTGTRSKAGNAKLERLTELNEKGLDGQLGEKEEKERQSLQAMMPSRSAALKLTPKPKS